MHVIKLFISTGSLISPDQCCCHTYQFYCLCFSKEESVALIVDIKKLKTICMWGDGVGKNLRKIDSIKHFISTIPFMREKRNSLHYLSIIK